MDEYIKKSYAVDAVLDVYYNTSDIDLSGGKFEAAIRKIQAADVAPVRHGRWLQKKHKIFGNAYDYVCSECGCDYALAEYNYCPNCGAKMDGGVDDG